MASVIDNTGTLKMTVGGVVIYAAKNICTVSEDGTNVSVRYSPTQQFEYLATAFTAPSGTAASIASAIAAMITLGGGAGTVTSVGLSLPSDLLTVSGSPVTGAGTLTGSKTSQSQNLFYASPSGSSGSPSFRALVSDDMPSGVLKNGIGIAAGTTIIGGIGTTDDLTFRTTSGAGTTGADFIWQGGNNGGTELMRLLNGGQLILGATTLLGTEFVSLQKNQNSTTNIVVSNTNGSSGAYVQYATTNGTSTTAIGTNGTGTTGGGVFGTANQGYVGNGGAAGLNIYASNAAGVIQFYAGGAATANERMRILSTGVTLVGGTAATGYAETFGNHKSQNSGTYTVTYNATNGTGAIAGTVNMNSAGNVAAFGITAPTFTAVGVYPQQGAYFLTDGPGGFHMSASNAAGIMAWRTGGTTERMRLDASGNLGLNTTTFGTNAVAVLGIKTGTAPTTVPADVVQIYSADSAGAGTGALSIYQEAAPVVSAATASTHKVPMMWNGTLYYVLLSNV